MKRTLLILGGYGNTGMLVSKLLLRESDVDLIIAGRNLEKAQQEAKRFNVEYQTNRVSAMQVDAANGNSLSKAFKKVDMVIVASSTIYYTREVAETAINCKIDYLDVQLSSPAKLNVLYSLKSQIVESGCCFITDGGFHPGVPAAMVRFATNKFDKLEVANVEAAFQLKWNELYFSKSTTQEFIEELENFNPLVYQNNQWIKLSMKNYPKIDFGEPFGTRYCTPMFLEELRSLPDQIPSLKETGFYIAGFNWVTDYIIIPLSFISFKISSKLAKIFFGNMFLWGLETFSRPPFGAVLQLNASGLKNGSTALLKIKLYHEDPYLLTAVPVVACLLQYLDGSIGKSGLWFQANFVEANRFFKDFERLGISVSKSSSQLLRNKD